MRVGGGAMTLDFSPLLSSETEVRLVGRTGIGLAQIEEECLD